MGRWGGIFRHEALKKEWTICQPVILHIGLFKKERQEVPITRQNESMKAWVFSSKASLQIKSYDLQKDGPDLGENPGI